MNNCIICDGKYSKNVLFENEHMIIMLAVEPSVNGHIQIFPKKHSTILEQIPSEELNLLVTASNKISMILFEVMKVHGTNIIINNGVPAGQKIPHFSIDIIPRRNDDSLKLDWELRQSSQENLDTMHRIITEAKIPKPEEKIETNNVKSNNKIIDIESSEKLNKTVTQEKAEQDKIKTDSQESQVSDNETSEDEPKKKINYYHKMFERIP